MKTVQYARMQDDFRDTLDLKKKKKGAKSRTALVGAAVSGASVGLGVCECVHRPSAKMHGERAVVAPGRRGPWVPGKGEEVTTTCTGWLFKQEDGDGDNSAPLSGPEPAPGFSPPAGRTYRPLLLGAETGRERLDLSNIS